MNKPKRVGACFVCQGDVIEEFRRWYIPRSEVRYGSKTQVQGGMECIGYTCAHCGLRYSKPPPKEK